MDYTINVYSGQSKQEHAPDINAYYELRKQAYIEVIGPEQAAYYGEYPTEHDARETTAFIIFKAKNPDTGEDVVFGGRRIVFHDQSSRAQLPIAGKHEIKSRASQSRFSRSAVQSLEGKDSLDVEDVIHALQVQPDIKCAELGAFALDQTITHSWFNKDEYVHMREAIYKKSLEAAKDAGADIVIIEPGPNNLRHQEEWLKSSRLYEFRRLGRYRSMFTNPFPEGQESQLLVINVSNRFKLKGPESILRRNQEDAQKNRAAKASRTL